MNIVTPRELQTTHTFICRYNFVYAPLLHRLSEMSLARQQVFVIVTTHQEKIEATVLGSVAQFFLDQLILRESSDGNAVFFSGRILDMGSHLKFNQPIQGVIYNDRSGLFIALSQTSYRLLPP